MELNKRQDPNYFRLSIVRQILGTVLFVFGLAASISVLTWERIFSNTFGYSTITTTQVLVVFLLGFAFGGYFFGRRADSRKNEISLYLFYNLALGVYTIVLLFILPFILPTIKLIFLKTNGSSFYLNSLNFGIIFILLIYPSALIGAALPTLGRFFIQSPNRVGYEIGNLTTLFFSGVTIGSVLCSFILYPIIGVKQSLVISGLLFLFCVFMLKILFSNIDPRNLLENDIVEKRFEFLSRKIERKSRIFRKLVNPALVLLGILFSSFMMLWTRCGYYVLDAKIYTSRILLITVFLGFSLGAIVYALFFRKHKKIYSGFALLAIAIGAYGIFQIAIFPLLSALNQKLLSSFQFFSFWNLKLLIYFLNSILIALIPGLLFGAGFVIANRILLINIENRGRIIGVAVFLFSLGCLLGLLITGLFLLPTVGIQKSIYFLSVANLIAGLIIVFAYSFQFEKFIKPPVIFIAVVFIVILSLLIPGNHIHKIYHKKNDYDKLVYVKEGLHTTVTIHKDIKTNYISLVSNGLTIGEKPEKHLIVRQILSHLPLFLHPKPDSILLIDFGEGNVGGRILLHHPAFFNCVENSSEVVNTSSIFNNFSKPFSNQTNFRLLSTNESYYLKFTEQKYNIIIKNHFHPGKVGNNNFFNKEFFQSCKDILTSPGILAVPVPLHGLSIEDFKILLRTFFHVFPSSSVWYNNNSLDEHLVLIGRKNLLNEIDVSQLHYRLSNSAIKQDLASTGLDNIYEILDCFIMGPSELNKLTLGVRINSENNPWLEFSAPKTPNDPIGIFHILQLLKSYREPIYPYISNIDTSIAERDIFMEYLNQYFTSSDRILDAIGARLVGETDQALSFYQQAYMLNRQDRAAKIFLDNYFDPYLYTSPKSPFEFTENAKIYFQKTEYGKSTSLLEQAININTNYSPAYFALGLNYEIMGDYKTAKQMYQKTLQLNPDLENVEERLKIVDEILEKQEAGYPVSL
ncbi:tetratricopeptide repeat protein [candidate division KSB1 bacterium]|nr:tetratricopeptide repeat protein [candidate division KSB1 bacterium]